jgi:drug/metabolite transporter (DMT)-like permease
MAVAIGWIAFGDFPNHWTWAGIAVIVASVRVSIFPYERGACASR